jgi:hypothetical protein
MKTSRRAKKPCDKKAHDDRLKENRERDVDFRDFLMAGEALLVDLARVQRGAEPARRTEIKELRESIRSVVRKRLCSKTMIREF